MSKHDITYEPNEKEDEDSSYISIPTVGDVKQNVAFGDQIGIYSDNGGVLEFDENLNIDDDDIQTFIKDNFVNPKAVSGLIRRITE